MLDPMRKSARLDELFQMLDHKEADKRVRAIEVLGETGDEHALKALRERMKLIGKEHHALIVAVGKLKKRLKVK